MRARPICATPGCPTPATSPPSKPSHCTVHARQANQSSHSTTRKRVYNSRRWKGLRRQMLAENPWCSVPECTNIATDLDHITPLRDTEDAYDRDNLQPLCRKHHSQKTQREVFRRK